MAKSKAEICNLAVSWLGGNQIFSLDDDSSMEARLCRANYDMSRLAVLEEREWSFAIKRTILTPLASSPAYGMQFAFTKPTDMLRLLDVVNKQGNEVRHLVEGNTILCDITEINVRYISDLENTKQFTGTFDQALAAHIAMDIAVALTENASTQQSMAMMYMAKLEIANTSDSLQGSREMLKTSQLEASRRLHTRPF